MAEGTTTILRFYRWPALNEDAARRLAAEAGDSGLAVDGFESEFCFNVEVAVAADAAPPVTDAQYAVLRWLFTETFEPDQTSNSSSFVAAEGGTSTIVEVGPRMAFSTAWSSNAVSICHACGLTNVLRVERSRRFLIKRVLHEADRVAFASMIHDRMTECVYDAPITTFTSGVKPESTFTGKKRTTDYHSNGCRGFTATMPLPCLPVLRTQSTPVPVLSEGKAALSKIDASMGLGFDGQDLDFYTKIFQEQLGRDPTNVEIYDLAQSNSEHSRHWFFGGRMVIDGVEMDTTLFKMVKATLPKDGPSNSVIAFHDNSSAIRASAPVPFLKPTRPGQPSPLTPTETLLHPILTAETHNFPCAVAPFPGAETGTGGRLRDVQATGRGAHTVAGISSYCFGNLQLEGYDLPWEDKSFEYPSHLAAPKKIAVEASNGASDYGNKYGEPVVHGFCRSFGLRRPGPKSERIEWVKPIMFSAGIGQLDDRHTSKNEAEAGMLVVKIGGPAYRIGMGGGAASSRVNDAASSNLDFNAVQRGDAEMENRMNRLVRACIELGGDNPIMSIHDQGCGGNGNVLKEIVEEKGADYDIRNVELGDPTLSVCEIWGAEYQENNALLLRPEDAEVFKEMAKRENCPMCIVGTVTDSGRVTVRDSSDDSMAVDLPLELVLGDLPPKIFDLRRIVPVLEPLALPEGMRVGDALDRILRLVSVASKRWLVHKVDRSVTGLIAQQQCVGALQLPLSNCAVIAQSHFTHQAIASACGEQPIKGLLDPRAMARLTVAEMVTNLMWARLTSLADVKASGNWMWAAKLEGEGARVWDACEALRDALVAIGAGIDGGKDSLSMAAGVGPETVKAPGMLTLTAYCTCPDLTMTVTPDLKKPGSSALVLIDLDVSERCRLGGSSLAHVYGQLGDDCPDLEDMSLLVRTFEAIQALIAERAILAGHDRSDGGLMTTLLEMAFAGNCGLDLNIGSATQPDPIALLFNEEIGIVIEVDQDKVDGIVARLSQAQVPARLIGRTTKNKQIKLSVSGAPMLDQPMVELRDIWEATGFELEKRQRVPSCVEQEQKGLASRSGPSYIMTYTVADSLASAAAGARPKVAVLRQEGSNGDREMAAAFHYAGLEAWDVTVSDLLQGRVHLSDFRGLVFVGGFSYADVLDSGKGWAAVIKFNPEVYAQFQAFRNRPDTFSLGICNGCQLLALLGWIPAHETSASASLEDKRQPRFVHNASGLFESRWSNVVIQESPSVLLKDMAGSSLGVWVAHGEGQVHFPDAAVLDSVREMQLAPIRYANDENEITEEYPFNPNGSPDGIAALCSVDGRHLAMMPHPERCFLSWQWPWMPEDMRAQLPGDAGPWLLLFQNARRFCDESAC